MTETGQPAALADGQTISAEDIEALKHAQRVIESRRLDTGLSVKELVEEAEEVFTREMAIRVEEEFLSAVDAVILARDEAGKSTAGDVALEALFGSVTVLHDARAKWLQWQDRRRTRED